MTIIFHGKTSPPFTSAIDLSGHSIHSLQNNWLTFWMSHPYHLQLPILLYMGLSEELGTSASNGKSKNMFHQHGNNMVIFGLVHWNHGWTNPHGITSHICGSAGCMASYGSNFTPRVSMGNTTSIDIKKTSIDIPICDHLFLPIPHNSSIHLSPKIAQNLHGSQCFHPGAELPVSDFLGAVCWRIPWVGLPENAAGFSERVPFLAKL